MTMEHARRVAALMAEPSRDEAHDPHRRARVERTRGEMMAQGAAITRTRGLSQNALREIATRLATRAIQRVVITGCGDSWFVGIGARHAWETVTGWPVEAAQALDFATYGSTTVDAHTLVIGLSAGGNTPAVMEALWAAQARGAFTIGVSNTPDSPVLRAFDGALVVHATRKGWPTQSSTATMALLIDLACAVAPNAGATRESLVRGLDDIPALIDGVAATLDAQMATLAQDLAPVGIILFTGLGPNLATAAFGAAKVKELSPIHALALPLEEYHHYRSQKRGDPIFVVATDPASRARALDTLLVSRAVGGHGIAIMAGEDGELAGVSDHVVTVPTVPSSLAALVASVPLHLFAYHFAMARFARGLGAAIMRADG